MLVFIDDSGDCGFKFDDGSSRYLVLAASVFKSRTESQDAWKRVNASRFVGAGPLASFVLKTEYKYAKTKLIHKDRFFEELKPASFYVRAIVVDKQRITSSHLRNNPNDMKAYMLMQLLTHTFGQVRDAKLVVDGNDTTSFGMQGKEYYLNRINTECPGTLSDVEFVDSKKNELIQMTDMIAGSLRKSIEGDGPAKQHFETYKQRLYQPKGSLWHFR